MFQGDSTEFAGSVIGDRIESFIEFLVDTTMGYLGCCDRIDYDLSVFIPFPYGRFPTVFRVKVPYAGAIPLLCCIIAGFIFYGISDLYLQCICVFVLIAAMVVGMPRYIKEQLRQILWAKLQKKP